MAKKEQIQKVSGTPQEVCAAFGLNPGTLGNLRHQRRGPKYHKAGRSVYYFFSDVEQWLRLQPVLTSDCQNL